MPAFRLDTHLEGWHTQPGPQNHGHLLIGFCRKHAWSMPRPDYTSLNPSTVHQLPVCLPSLRWYTAPLPCSVTWLAPPFLIVIFVLFVFLVRAPASLHLNPPGPI